MAEIPADNHIRQMPDGLRRKHLLRSVISKNVVDGIKHASPPGVSVTAAARYREDAARRLSPVAFGAPFPGPLLRWSDDPDKSLDYVVCRFDTTKADADTFVRRCATSSLRRGASQQALGTWDAEC